MAGAAALSQLGVAFHRAGMPVEQILALHRAIEEGKYVVMLRGAESEVAQWQEVLQLGNPLKIDDLPYCRMIDKQ